MSNAKWPGKDLGLPSSGQGSLASIPRRAAALLIDWLSCLLISNAFFATDNAATMLIFFAVQVIFIAAIGSSLGQMLMRIRVVQLGHMRVSFRSAVIRTLMLCLVLPTLITDDNNRGLHDKLAKTVIVNSK